MSDDSRPADEFTIPLYSYDLIRMLDAWWPHTCPPEGHSLERIHRYAGGRALIDSLMAQMHEEEASKEVESSPEEKDGWFYRKDAE